MTTERLNYIIDNSIEGKTYYVGYPVNFPGVIIQAESLEELKKKAKDGVQSWLKMWKETMALQEPFELKEFSEQEWNKLK